MNWVYLDITSPSGKILYACTSCGHTTPAPTKTHVCDPSQLEMNVRTGAKAIPESAPMNSDHAPTAEEQLPPLDVTQADKAPPVGLYLGMEKEFLERLNCRTRQLLAALRENRELRKCCNLGGNPLRLDGVHVKCAADPKDEHEIYGGGMRQPGGRIFCELHAHRAMCAEKDARIAELEQACNKNRELRYKAEESLGDVHSARMMAEARAEAAEAKLAELTRERDHTWTQRNTDLFAERNALRAKLRAVSDALERAEADWKSPEIVVIDWRTEFVDDLLARIRAIVEGK